MIYNGPMGETVHRCNYAHPLDVLDFLAEAQTHETCALVLVTGTVGGGVRAPGDIMAVTRSGKTAGYVSNGCVDAAVVLNAQEAIVVNKTAPIRYGKGSPFLDIQLPCGGSIDLLILPDPDTEIISEAVRALRHRRPVKLIFSPDGTLRLKENEDGKSEWQGKDFAGQYLPKPKLRIVGRGTEVLALTRLALASDLEVILQSPDEPVVTRAKALGAAAELIRLGDSPDPHDDPWTAFILMFHDHNWESDILVEALKTKAFYIGALGSRKTHEIRCATLKARGVSEFDIDRIKAPIGLIPSVRDASMLAISTLADVAAAFQEATT